MKVVYQYCVTNYTNKVATFQDKKDSLSDLKELAYIYYKILTVKQKTEKNTVNQAKMLKKILNNKN